MSGIDGAVQLSAGVVLLCAVASVWRRDVRALITFLSLQGMALSSVALELAWHGHDAALATTGALVLLVKGVVIPTVVRAVARRGAGAPHQRPRETRPLVNVPASLVIAAVLVALSYVATSDLGVGASAPGARWAPLGVATILVGYFFLVTRRHSVSKVVGIVLVDNGVALTTFLLTSGVSLVVELGATLDVLLVIVVIQFLTVAMRGHVDVEEISEMRSLHD